MGGKGHSNGAFQLKKNPQIPDKALRQGEGTTTGDVGLMSGGEATKPTIEKLLLTAARTKYWAVLYGTAHPNTASRIREFHETLSAALPAEPGNRLLLGVVRDKFLYLNEFFGKGNKLIRSLTEHLYLLGVATISFGPQVPLSELLVFFDFLHRNSGEQPGEPFEGHLQRTGVTGITINAYNYKELLSRKTVECDGAKVKDPGREDFLLKSLLTSNFTHDDEAERKIIEEIVNFPELLPVVIKRAHASERVGGPSTGPAEEDTEKTISPEVLRRLFHRLGGVLGRLPEEQRKNIFAFLEAGIEIAGEAPKIQEAPLDLFIAQSLTDDRTGEEFLDLLGTVLSVEDKTAGRFRKIFETLAVKRDASDSLLPSLSGRVKESIKSRDYYSLKTWETVEKLLLSRSDDKYVAKDHARFLERISSEDFKNGSATPAVPIESPLLATLAPEERYRKSVLILLNILSTSDQEEVFYDLLGEIRMAVTNLLSRNELSLLKEVLFGMDDGSKKASRERNRAIQETLQKTDFGHLIDFHLSDNLPANLSGTILSILSRFAAVTTLPVLDRLLSETSQSRRRTLLKMAVHLGPSAMPFLRDRLAHPKWYFVRNICYIMGEIRDRQAVPGLLGATKHADRRVRREAIVALGKLRIPEVVPPIGKILLEGNLFSSAEDDSVRIAAANALFMIGGTEATSYLHRGSRSIRVPVREYCKQLWASQGAAR